MLQFLIFSAICLLVQGQKPAPMDWWQTSVIYQIYPRSFKDSDGDGVGDLRGIAEKVPYLKKLGVGAVWLSPIFQSPMADFGYDISNFTNIEPIFGSMTDFEKLKDALHAQDIKLILDFVPNHSSDEHEWFVKSVQKIDPYTDYYVWHDGKMVNGTRQPPNNWISGFSYSAWEWHPERQQYYLHQFHKKQPDLNYRSPYLVEEMKNILRFWLDRGVDGFRMDIVLALFEDERFLDEPPVDGTTLEPWNHDYHQHIYIADQPETYDMIKQWRKVLDEYTKKDGHPRVMMTEAYSPIDKTMGYYGNTTHPGAHFTFNFLFITDLNAQSTANDFEKVIMKWYDNLPAGKWPNWVMGNHDQRRVASRFGIELLDGLHMIQMVLPGTSVTYNGDEIGMEDTFIRWDQTVDPQGMSVGKDNYLRFTRDPQRTPFQWDHTTSAGFSTNPKTWLPVNPNYWRLNYRNVKREIRSHFRVYQQLVALKEAATIQHGDLNVFALSKYVLAFTRSYEKNPTYVVVVNIGSEIETTEGLQKKGSLPKYLTVYSASINSGYTQGRKLLADKIKLRPKAGLVLFTAGNEGVLDSLMTLSEEDDDKELDEMASSFSY
nr:PREDICTED: maltase A3-like [Bemisia tabaci]XP_018907800.1 PREDICTED: maltase A3-like [Bemisia tabaci]